MVNPDSIEAVITPTDGWVAQDATVLHADVDGRQGVVPAPTRSRHLCVDNLQTSLSVADEVGMVDMAPAVRQTVAQSQIRRRHTAEESR